MCNSGKGHQFPLFGWGLAKLTESQSAGGVTKSSMLEQSHKLSLTHTHTHTHTNTHTHTHTHTHTLALTVPDLPPSVVFPPPPVGIAPVVKHLY